MEGGGNLTTKKLGMRIKFETFLYNIKIIVYNRGICIWLFSIVKMGMGSDIGMHTYSKENDNSIN